MKSNIYIAAILLSLCLNFNSWAAVAVDQPGSAPPLSPSAKEVVKDLGVLPDVHALLEAENTSGKDSLEALRLRERLVESIITASFEIRSSISRIDTEISATNEIRDVMADHRERNNQTSDVINFMNSGTSTIVNNALTEFNRGPATGITAGGGIVGLVGGALNIGISTLSVKLNKGEHNSSPVKPNMLAPVFGYTGSDAKFTEGVESYLSDPYPGAVIAGETRRLHLVRQWVRLGRLPAPSTAPGQRRIGLLTGLAPQYKSITIDLLEDRSLMLSDLRAAISQMDIDMLEIMRWVKTL